MFSKPHEKFVGSFHKIHRSSFRTDLGNYGRGVLHFIECLLFIRKLFVKVHETIFDQFFEVGCLGVFYPHSSSERKRLIHIFAGGLIWGTVLFVVLCLFVQISLRPFAKQSCETSKSFHDLLLWGCIIFQVPWLDCLFSIEIILCFEEHFARRIFLLNRHYWRSCFRIMGSLEWVVDGAIGVWRAWEVVFFSVWPQLLFVHISKISVIDQSANE